jgi:hypothetical protein
LQLPQYSAVLGNFTKSREYDIEEKLINLQRLQRIVEEQIAEFYTVITTITISHSQN